MRRIVRLSGGRGLPDGFVPEPTLTGRSGDRTSMVAEVLDAVAGSRRGCREKAARGRFAVDLHNGRRPFPHGSARPCATESVGGPGRSRPLELSTPPGFSRQPQAEAALAVSRVAAAIGRLRG